MSLPTAIQQQVEETVSSGLTECNPLSGGDINATWRLGFENGQRAVLKHNNQAPQAMFAAEAEGLHAMAETGTLKTPAVMALLESVLLLEYIEPGPRTGDFWQTLGRQLAHMHEHRQPAHGFSINNFCGLTPQPNPWTADGHRFFAEQRLLFQGRLARDGRLLEKADLVRLEMLADRLPALIPKQPAALLHGDLWSGNLLCNRHGIPVLIDPACYYGWPEAELAMTALFGGYPPEFYAAYESVRALEPGWRARLPIYNLYHLLNHLNLFGGAYRRQVLDVLDRFA